MILGVCVKDVGMALRLHNIALDRADGPCKVAAQVGFEHVPGDDAKLLSDLNQGLWIRGFLGFDDMLLRRHQRNIETGLCLFCIMQPGHVSPSQISLVPVTSKST